MTNVSVEEHEEENAECEETEGDQVVCPPKPILSQEDLGQAVVEGQAPDKSGNS
eukprot:CAMPEP_0184314624 /NCGR_PEP_ID=MMETSP1049-20130417/75937_1 /TAXON_ID=77928 /ORGANISM="Proteomonas sulcata, Strain CCMP704" /LENGTH=53 /DNA_ID=CAMNT_0026632633 /DNA_START=54 /DNA_END=213 /DNA_ORIENTATION=-